MSQGRGRDDAIGERDEGNEEGWESVGIEEVHVFVFEVLGDVSMVKRNTEG